MTAVYRLFGNELSPYSVKVRSYLRFKAIPHQWIVRNASTEDEFARYAKLPLIPLLITPTDEALQDSTPIIETFEQRFPQPSITPDDPALIFLSALLEEYADEWLNKPMFHYRWHYEADAQSAAERLAHSLFAEVSPQAVEIIRKRMTSRLHLVGSSDATKEVIEQSFQRLAELLDTHLVSRPYVLGARPSLADFGLYGQLYECLSDPTPGAWLRQHAPRVVTWIERMEAPQIEGAFESREELVPTLEPILREAVGDVFVPWTLANERALRSGHEQLEVVIQGQPFRQAPQKYHAKSLAMLRQKYERVGNEPWLRDLLSRTGCVRALSA